VPNRLVALAPLLLGALAAAGFAPLELWPLTLLAFAGFLTAAERAKNLRGALWRGWLFGLGHFVVGLNWIATAFYYQDSMPHWLGWFAVVLLALYLAVYPAIAAGLIWRHGRRDPIRLVLIGAIAWMITEYMRASFFTGFAWNPLGVIWADTPVASLARWIGTYGLSGITLLIAGGLLLLGRRRWREGLAILVPIAVAVIAAMLLRPAPAVTDKLIRVVQPNIGQGEKYTTTLDAQHFETLARLSGHAGPVPRLILWPEAAIPDFLEDEPYARAKVAALLGPRDIIMTGGDAIIWGPGDGQTQRAIGARNSLFTLDSHGRILARYDKSHLVPYGEYLPMRPLLSAIGLSRLAPGDLDFWPGPGPQSYAIPGFGTIGIQICYEIIFSGEVIDEAHRPAFLFNPSNDAWFGPTGPPQHLAQARLRAIEEGLPVVRATPTGISAVVDADGRLIDSLPLHAAGAIELRLPAAHPPTAFARYGNLLPLLFGLLLGIGAIARARKPR
jgi:apolipoprotein N-acyltransferase